MRSPITSRPKHGLEGIRSRNPTNTTTMRARVLEKQTHRDRSVKITGSASSIAKKAQPARYLSTKKCNKGLTPTRSGDPEVMTRMSQVKMVQPRSFTGCTERPTPPSQDGSTAASWSCVLTRLTKPNFSSSDDRNECCPVQLHADEARQRELEKKKKQNAEKGRGSSVCHCHGNRSICQLALDFGCTAKLKMTHDMYDT